MIPKNSAIALPRSSSGNDATTIPTAAGNISAAAAPWSTRKKMIQLSPMLPVGVRPQNTEAPANPITPMVTIRRRPSTSPRRPPNANSADSESR